LASWLEASNVNPTDVDPTDVDPTDCLLIPVPIHWKRRLGRGYNQSETIAQGIQAVFPGMEILPRGVFVRTRATQTQTRYSEEKRARNIRGAIAVSQHANMVERLNTLAVKRPVWILVDDVFTSGATLFECSSVLYEWVGRSDSLAKGHDIALHAWVVANAEDGM
jgi:predicted amidophosphoribosyltransferase